MILDNLSQWGILEEMLTKPVQIQKLGGGSGGLVLEATLGGGSEKEGKICQRMCSLLRRKRSQSRKLKMRAETIASRKTGPRISALERRTRHFSEFRSSSYLIFNKLAKNVFGVSRISSSPYQHLSN